MTAAWLRTYLETTGRANTDGIGRVVRVGLCRDCGAQVVRGLDDEICAIPVTCDPTPIDTLGEALATITARRTYDLTGPARRPNLDPRRPDHIRRPRRYPVLVTHLCGQPLPADTTPAPPRPAPTDEVPF